MSTTMSSAARPEVASAPCLTYRRFLACKSQYFLAAALLGGGIANCAWAELNAQFGSMNLTYTLKPGEADDQGIPGSFFGAAWDIKLGERAPTGIIEEIVLDKALVLPAGIMMGMSLDFESDFQRVGSENHVTCMQKVLIHKESGQIPWVVKPWNDCDMKVWPFMRYVADITSSGTMQLVNNTDKPFRFTTNLTVKMYQGAQVRGIVDFTVGERKSCTIDIADSLYLGKISASRLQKITEGEIVDDLGGMLGAVLKCNHNRAAYLTITSSSTSTDGCASDNLGSLNYCAYLDGKKLSMGEKYGPIWRPIAETKNITFLATKGKKSTGGKSQAQILLTFEPR
ncbi:hypothetical protein [Erwinia tasmaniensis]|nr:hypothetical protein [Erwinia tasmaniensis]